MTKKVFVVGGDASVRLMFHNEGWANVDSPYDADFICFTGGEDVSPELYGQVNAGLSHTNPKRDQIEVGIFNEFREKDFIGICRGGQLLNVLNGGSMIQDIDDFHGGNRTVIMYDGSRPSLHEDHHQGMVPGVGATILGVDRADLNYEILWYEKATTRSLCFQAHPEWGCQVTEDLFFNLIKEKFA